MPRQHAKLASIPANNQHKHHQVGLICLQRLANFPATLYIASMNKTYPGVRASKAAFSPLGVD